VKALDLMAALVLEDGRRWGEAAMPEQWQDARAILDPGSATPYHFLTRARGWSKTADLAGMAIAVMLEQLPPGSRLYGLAADRDQGRLLLDSIAGFEQRTPMLRGVLDVGAFRAASVRGGSVLEILAADLAGAWGLRPAFLVVDELAAWGTTESPRRLWEAASTAAAKIGGSRMVVLTTAGDPAHWSRKVLDHALGDSLWGVHEVEGPPPWLDPERIEEQRRRLPESSFRRLFHNEWVTAEDRLTTADDLAACVTLDGPLPPEPGMRYVIGVDLGLKHDRTVAAVCHLARRWDTAATAFASPESPPRGLMEAVPDDTLPAATVMLDRMAVWQGTREHAVPLEAVEAWILQARHTFNGAGIVFDPWQAVGMAQRLRGRGLQVEEFTFSPASVGRLASTLHLLLRNRQLRLPDDPELLDELANVRLRETSPGVLRMDHDPDQHDDRAIALALAAQHLLDRSARGRVGVGPRIF
jgi:phage terminase large subunit-like protein